MSDLQKIEAAIASGELVVRLSDQSQVTYRSIAELERAAAYLRTREGVTPMNRTTTASFFRD